MGTPNKFSNILNSNNNFYYLDTIGRNGIYKNEVGFDSFELNHKFNSDILTVKYKDFNPVYISDKDGFSITHLKCLIENLKNYKPKIVIINMKQPIDRLYEHSLYWILEELIDKKITQLIIEYDYDNIDRLKTIDDNISIRFGMNNSIKDIDTLLDTYKNIGMIKINEKLASKYINNTNKFKRLKELSKNTIIVIEGGY